jgi:hypothetical protein
MTSVHADAQATGTSGPYRPLLAVSEAIGSHRDLPALLHELAGRLHHEVRFDYLALVLHEAVTDTMRPHVLGASEPTPYLPVIDLPVEDDPAGLVWRTQEPLILSSAAEGRRWPQFLERMQAYGLQSTCLLPLTTARRRLGTPAFTSSQPTAYEAAGAGFAPPRCSHGHQDPGQYIGRRARRGDREWGALTSAPAMPTDVGGGGAGPEDPPLPERRQHWLT